MAWLVLIVSGVLESVWAISLERSNGFTRLWPSIVFGITLILSMAGLAIALKSLPVGTAYAVWVGVGATLTVGYAMATGLESFSVLKLIFICFIVGGVVGLKLVH